MKMRTSLRQALVEVVDKLFSRAQALRLIQIPAAHIALKTFAIFPAMKLRLLLPVKSRKRVCVDWHFHRRH